jgi:hypothetical protein
LICSPGGRALDVQLYGGKPPVATGCALYATLIVPVGREIVARLRGGVTIVSDNVLFATWALLVESVRMR